MTIIVIPHLNTAIACTCNQAPGCRVKGHASDSCFPVSFSIFEYCLTSLEIPYLDNLVKVKVSA